MQRFDFKLARVLDLRHTQLCAAETALEQERIKRSDLQTALDTARQAAVDAGRNAKACPWVNPVELAHLGSYTARLDREATHLLGRLAAQHEEIKRREQAVVEARRRFRLLEMLRDKRLAEWELEANRESASLTDDFTAAQIARQRRKGG